MYNKNIKMVLNSLKKRPKYGDLVYEPPQYTH